MFIVEVNVDNGEHVHVKIFKSLPHENTAPELAE